MMRTLRENLSLRIASLVLAILVWAYVRGEDRPVQVLPVPLLVEGLAPDLAVAGEITETVNVRVRAPEAVLKTITPEKLLARVDLSSLGVGDQMVRVRPEALRVPGGVEVVRVTPEYIPLTIERKVRREIPVRPRVAGEPASGHVLGEVTVSPPVVTVEGPESAVRGAREVVTDIVRIDGRSSPFSIVVNLFPDRAGVALAGVRSTELAVDLHERYVTRVLPAVRVTAEGADRGPFQIRLQPATLAVTLEGPPGALTELEEGQVTAVVDVGPVASRPGEYRLEPRVVIRPEPLGGRVTVRSIAAREITVHVLTRRAR